jgi:effector-binding domain-containing protein
VVVHLLPGGLAVSLVHRGPYALLGRSYEKVFSHVRSRGLVALTPSYEVYLRGPGAIFRGDPRRYLTEIQVRVAPA